MTIQTEQYAGTPIKKVSASGKASPGSFFWGLILLFSILFGHAATVSAENESFQITANYSGVVHFQTITVDFCDDWLLQPDDQYNHKLAQASFAMAVTSFRSQIYDIPEKDHDILDFLNKAGFIEPRSDDYDRETGIDTIADLIAHKKVGDHTIIAVAISGNNYQKEWLSNFTISNKDRPVGFDSAAKKVMGRLEDYIRTHNLAGDLRLWVSGFSRAAAVSNILAADAVESHRFQGVYAYTFATPRTTREAGPDRYHNIFNILDPEDIVPMVPFPEWGYERYGKDLFIPSISTDSLYNEKYFDAIDAGLFTEDDKPILNPRLRRELHTIFDYISFFVNSPETYMHSLQDILIHFYENRSITDLIKEAGDKIRVTGILNSFRNHRSKFLFNLYEYYNFLDFLSQIIFRSFIANVFDMGDQYDYWRKDLSILENVAFGHLEETYRDWLFLSDDPSKILMEDPKYFHFTIWGDVDVEIYDDQGALIEGYNNKGEYSFDAAKVLWPDFDGKVSMILTYADRQEDQTLVVFPADRIYMIYIHSNKDQALLVSNVEYSSEKLMADFKYSYFDHYDKDEGYLEVIDPQRERLTADEVPEDFADVTLVDPWDESISYSPTAIMRLETGGIFLAKSLPVMIILHIIVNQILGLLIVAIVRIIKAIIIFGRKKLLGKDTPFREDILELPEAKKRTAGSQLTVTFE